MKSLRKIFISMVLACLLLTLMPGQPVFAQSADNGYYISNFDVVLTANEKREFTVTETIDVVFKEQRHGIYRYIPYYSDAEKMSITNVKVTGGKVVQESTNDYLKLVIGNADTTVKGSKRYIIQYTMVHYADYVPDKDYLYVNLIGTQWNTHISKASMKVTLPASANILSYKATSGIRGSIKNDAVAVKQTGNVFTLSSNRRLNAFEGVTINVEMAEGAFSAAPVKVLPYTIENVKGNVNINTDKTVDFHQQYTFSFNESVSSLDFTFPAYDKENKRIEVKKVSVAGGAGSPKIIKSSSEKDSFSAIRVQLPSVQKGAKLDILISYTLDYKQDYDFNADSIDIDLLPFRWDSLVKGFTMDIQAPSPNSYTVQSGRLDQLAQDTRLNMSENDSGLSVSLKAGQQLASAEGITYTAVYPQGFFHKPMSIYGWVLLISSLLCLVITALSFARLGKDEPLAPVVEFYPPDGMSPAMIGYVINGAADNRDITSLVFYWASHGHLTIENNDGVTTMHKVNNLDAKHPAFESQMFDEMFRIGGGTTVNTEALTNVFYKSINAAKLGVRGYFSGQQNLSDGKADGISFLCAFLAALLSAGSFVVALMSNGGMIGGLLPVLFLGALPAGIVSILMYIYLKGQFVRKKAANGLFKVFLGIVTVVLAAVHLLVLIGLGLEVPAALVAVPVIYACALWSPFITRRSEYGQKILERVLGFKQFLQDAEREKLEALLEQNPSYYYDILPYALVLGVTNIWAKKFDGMITEPPQWYSGNMSTFNTIMLANYMMHSMNSVSNAMTSIPQNTGNGSSFGGGGGFGGGGFSGGGSGGGGGGSW